MIRVRVTFSVIGMTGNITHEILVTSTDKPTIRQTLDDDISCLMGSNNEPMKVKEIKKVVELTKYSQFI